MSNTPTEPTALGADAPAAKPVGEEVMPGWDVPMAMLVTEPVEGDIPMALPVESPSPAEAEPVPVATPAPTDPDLLLEPEPAPSAIVCPACTASNPVGQPYCSDCGYYFSANDLAATVAQSVPETAPALLTLLQGRYELGELLSDRLGVQRYRAIDRGDDSRPTLEVAIVRQKFPPTPAPSIVGAEDNDDIDDILPSFDDPSPQSFPATEILVGQPLWPSIAWERKLLRTLEHPGLPAERDHFTDDE